MADIQKDMWKQLLEKAAEFTLQVNDPVRWAKNFLNVDLKSNQEEIIKSLCDPKVNYLGILGSRGGGKSFAVCVGLIRMCEDYPGLDVGIFGPRADQATRLISETKKLLATSAVKTTVDWEHTTNDKIIFKNGSYLLALSAAETSLQEGWHFSTIVVDEAHRVSNASMSERIIPMLGSKKISKLIKIGIPLFKNHFYSSYSDDKYKFLVHDWARSPILLESGSKALRSADNTTKEYPTFVLDRMPKTLKAAMFPDHPEMHYDGDMTEMEFNTQYGMIWMDDINTFLRGDEPETLVGTHDPLMAARAGEDYFFGLDTSSGTLVPGKYDLDFTALSIWRRRGDGTKEKVWCREWQNSETLAQAEEIAGIIHPQTGLFPCAFGCVDYSNVGITSVEMFKRLKIPVAGVIFSTTEPTSHKNYKNAMANQFQFELQAGRIKYPKMESIDRDKIMRKHYHQWLALERIVSVGLNDKISAPPGAGHDDGCFSGDTPIPLLNGTTPTIKELSEGSVENKYTYSIDPATKLIVPGKILKAWKTGTKETVAVTLDNGEVIRCTPDHQIMLRDGTYREAKDLKSGDSLMPLYRRVTSQNSRWANYELVKDLRNNQWIGTHKLIASVGSPLEEKVVHHKDYNSRNNNPDNLVILTQSEHLTIHNNSFWKDLSPEERRERIMPASLAGAAAIKKLVKEDPAFRKKLSDRALDMWKDPEFRKKNGEAHQKWLDSLSAEEKKQIYSSFLGKHHTEEHKQYMSERLTGIVRSKETCEKISESRKKANIPSWCKGLSMETNEVLRKAAKKSSQTKLAKRVGQTKVIAALDILKKENLSITKSNWEKFTFDLKWVTFQKYLKKFPELGGLVISNHSVVKVEKSIIQDVYDLTIETYHNFAIGQGIFVHNCCADLLACWAADKSATFNKVQSTFRIGVASANTSIVQKRPGGSNRYL